MKTILVTGPARGLGLAISEKLVNEGYQVIGVGRKTTQDFENLISGKLFNKLILEIKETPCRDKTGYYLENSSEILTHEALKKMNIEINSILKELATNKIFERYSVIYEYCKQYYSWALNKKFQQSEDITKQQNFETSDEPPLKL